MYSVQLSAVKVIASILHALETFDAITIIAFTCAMKFCFHSQCKPTLVISNVMIVG